MLFGDVADRFGMRLEGRVVDQYVEATELFDGIVDRVLAERRIADIARDCDAASTLGLDRAAGLFGIGMLTQIDDRHVRALARKEHGNCASNTRVPAGDQANHAVELAAAHVGRRLVVRLRGHRMLVARLR